MAMVTQRLDDGHDRAISSPLVGRLPRDHVDPPSSVKTAAPIENWGWRKKPMATQLVGVAHVTLPRPVTPSGKAPPDQVEPPSLLTIASGCWLPPACHA